LADNKPTKCKLKTAVQTNTRAYIHSGIPVIKSNQDNYRLLTDSNPSSRRGFATIDVPVATSHYPFFFKSNRRLADS